MAQKQKHSLFSMAFITTTIINKMIIANIIVKNVLL